MKNKSGQLLSFKSIIDLLLYFDTQQKCIEYLINMRWGKEIRCPHCRNKNPYKFKNTIDSFKCSYGKCNKKFNVKTKSIFEGSKIPLNKWFAAIYLFSSHKKGLSSIQMAKDIGITQKSAWFMLHRIREMFNEELEFKLSGTIEIDETFVGGKNKNRHTNKKYTYSGGRSFKDKTPVLGMICRETKKVHTVVLKNTTREEIQPIVRDCIESGSNLYTDEWAAYRGLNDEYYHNFIQHGLKEYAKGDVHTNNIEGFWSHLKRGVIGVYHQTTKKHLQAYCNEFAFRYNTKDFSETERLNQTIFNSFNKRLKYNDLIGHEDFKNGNQSWMPDNL